jgi:hypothetical protein
MDLLISIRSLAQATILINLEKVSNGNKKSTTASFLLFLVQVQAANVKHKHRDEGH